MADLSRDGLKVFFETNKRPVHTDFVQLIDETVNKIDDKATETEAEDHTIDDRFITPKTAKKAVEKFAPVKKVNNESPDANGNVTLTTIAASTISGEIPQTQVTDLVSDLASKQDALVSGTNIKTLNGESLLGAGNVIVSNQGSSNFYETDFLIQNAVQTPFLGTGSGSGMAAYEINHPGIAILKKIATANSGYAFMTVVNSLGIKDGLKCNLIFKLHTATSGKILRFGFLNSNTSASPTNGAYFEVNGLSLSSITKNRNTTSSNSILTFPSVTPQLWYHLKISVVSVSQIMFEVFDSSGSLINSNTMTTNIPYNATNPIPLGCGVSAYGTSTVADDLFYVDYMDLSLGNLSRSNL